MIMWCFTTSIIVASVVVCLSHFGGLWGNLKTASEAFKAKFYLRFDASNLNYPGIYLHIAWNSHYGGLWGHGGLHMTSEVTSDLKFELSGLNNPCFSGLQISVFEKSSGRSQISSKDLLASPPVISGRTCQIFPVNSFRIISSCRTTSWLIRFFDSSLKVVRPWHCVSQPNRRCQQWKTWSRGHQTAFAKDNPRLSDRECRPVGNAQRRCQISMALVQSRRQPSSTNHAAARRERQWNLQKHIGHQRIARNVRTDDMQRNCLHHWSVGSQRVCPLPDRISTPRVKHCPLIKLQLQGKDSLTTWPPQI